jgi:hypothetical protein
LDDGEHDFEDEIDLEEIRQEVVRKIRENIQSEVELNELDVKIALLVKNRISIEEVVFSTRKMKQQLDKIENELASTEKDHNPFVNSSKSLDKEARAKLESYQQLFYLLQTQPQYLSRLMFNLNKKNSGSALKFLEQSVLTLFGYAQQPREEYLLLNLIKVDLIQFVFFGKIMLIYL